MSMKESILNKIADYLSRRDHSVKEIQEKLAQKKIYDPLDIEVALERAQKMKWFLPAEELAEKVYHSLARKNKSFHFVQNYLIQKGLPQIDFQEDLELSAIKTVLRKKFKTSKITKYDDKIKAFGLLSQKGFEKEVCEKAIGQFNEEL